MIPIVKTTHNINYPLLSDQNPTDFYQKFYPTIPENIKSNPSEKHPSAAPLIIGKYNT